MVNGAAEEVACRERRTRKALGRSRSQPSTFKNSITGLVIDQTSSNSKMQPLCICAALDFTFHGKYCENDVVLKPVKWI